jgi:hypothetical protein
MKIITLHFLLAVGIINTAFGQDSIPWNSAYHLKWEDFQGKPEPNSEFGAISRCAIKYSLTVKENTYNYKVDCEFHTKISWTKDFDSVGLRHEQGHFNIAELFARKLRKRFSTYKFNPSKIMQDFRNLFELNNKERLKMDNLYDQETDFSRNRPKQFYWNKKILIELKKYQAYSQ